MKRRSFLQSIIAGITALFMPKVAAEKVTTEIIGDLVWTTTDSGRVLNVTKRPIAKAEEPVAYLSEAALEDAIIEINDIQSATGKRIAFEPTTIWCYPNGQITDHNGRSYKTLADAINAV